MSTKVCVYTAIFGGYDDLKPIAKQTANCDFVCFSDRDFVHNTQWEIKPFFTYIAGTHPRMVAKRFKVLPSLHSRLNNYDILIWIDGSAEITSPTFVEDIIHHLEGKDMVLFNHPDRDCIYEEATVSATMAKYHDQPLQEQVNYYREGGHPEHGGLFACGMIARRPSNRTKAFDTLWWREILKWSVQDQLSFPVVLTQCDIKIGIFPYNLWDNEYVRFKQHNSIW